MKTLSIIVIVLFLLAFVFVAAWIVIELDKANKDEENNKA
jgi:uncharacterized protein YneF (UPF0154 family)